MILLSLQLEDIAKNDRLNTGPLRWLLVHHLLEESDEVLAHEVGVLANLIIEHLVLKFVHLCCWEGIAQAADLVEDYAEGPDIRGRTVLRILP